MLLNFRFCLIFINMATDLQNFYSLYRDPQSDIFVDKDTERIFQKAKKEAILNPIKRSDIQKYKLSLSTLSRDKERRILRGRRRVLSYRKWLTYGENNILCADTAFLPDFRNPKGKKKTILVFLDSFSRLCYLTLCSGTSAKESASKLPKVFAFFGKPPLKFTSDRGKIILTAVLKIILKNIFYS